VPVEHLNAVVVAVGDYDLAGAGDSDSQGESELPVTVAPAAEREQELVALGARVACSEDQAQREQRGAEPSRHRRRHGLAP
jgi:hypothetical protein